MDTPISISTKIIDGFLIDMDYPKGELKQIRILNIQFTPINYSYKIYHSSSYIKGAFLKRAQSYHNLANWACSIKICFQIKVMMSQTLLDPNLIVDFTTEIYPSKHLKL